MKRLGIFLFLIVVLAACGGANGQDGGEEDQEKNKEQTTQEADEKKDSAKEEKDENNKVEKEEKSEKSEEAAAEASADEPKEAQYQITGNWSFEPINDAEPKVALLTIDDAPDKHGLEMAKTLKAADAPAIFFVNGHFIDSEEGKEELRKIHELGFPIGNHTMTHASLPDLSQEEQKEEIVGLNDKIEEITGERPKFFRAPFGQNTDYSQQLAAEEKMLLMNWTYGYDWNEEYMDADNLADIMVNTELLGNGANLLMHDREWTKEALDDIVTGLRSKGYDLLDPALIKTPK
ncbi:polysaccharide deacetylase [Halobacillus halophilus]|uniref:Polysaccharide deacetylase n=1 Tax=Halobacillus halophilus (strain ATCC 35676 / DSM 2266 / JCM 20832 / KCTC 3685 / LMG 17431 / NBRC 102448 / NCIMB 2269) TaxID=866895 RepID=I0JLZ5_HALH3|nr:polysaccharide deacetylase family protein [Halobacillus halophilus]ASF39261.1 polysaccharide deacetylase [Halobacillus halophilus]CCG45165.1 polysaccharide deacetylase [Halobacillus halophilus DSM 2266]